MSKIANDIFPVLLMLFQGYCLQYFYGSFLESRTLPVPRQEAAAGRRIRPCELCWGKRWNGLAVTVLYGLARIALSRADWTDIWDYRTAVGKLALSLFLSLILAVCFYKAFHLITVFLAVAFQAAADISRYTVVILLGELGEGLLDLWNWCIQNRIITSEKAFGIAVNAGLLAEWIVEYLAMGLLLYFSLKKIVRDFQEKEYGIHRTELLFLLTPAAVGLMICLLLRIIIITMEDGVPKILYDRYPVLIFVIPAILLLSLLSILQGVRLFQDMIYWNRERSRRVILEKQVEGMQEHMEEMERIYSGIRSMKHDMKNTLSVIQRLSAREGMEEKEELQIYLSELNRTFDTLEVRFSTGNTIVDTLLNMKYHEALREVPDLHLDADGLLFPQDLEIRGYDIGVILGNALDNAIEACKKLREREPKEEVFIRLCSMQKGNLLILKVVNSYDGHLSKRGAPLSGERQQGFPATEKPDKNLHGIGLSNIKGTAEKYQGTMDFKAEGKVFILSVMMKNQMK